MSELAREDAPRATDEQASGAPSGDPADAAGPAEPPEPTEPAGSADAPEPAGQPDVDAVLASLDQLDGKPVSEHVAVFEAAHDRLRGALADAGDGSGQR